MSGETRFLDRVRQALDAETGHPGPEIRHGLARARREALHGKRAPRGGLVARKPGRLGFAAVGVAAVAIAAVVFLGRNGSVPEVDRLASPRDMEILASDKDLGFYGDLEFCAWLAERGDEG